MNSLASRLHLFEAVITTTVLFGACTWAFTREMCRELDVARRKMLRYVLRVFWRKGDEDWATYMQRSARIIDATSVNFNLTAWSTQAKARKWKYAGFLARCQDQRWSQCILDWTPEQYKRPVGRPPIRWIDDIVEYAGDGWKDLAQDTDAWDYFLSGYESNFPK